MNLSLPLVVGASGFDLPETQTCSTKNLSPAILSVSEYAPYKWGRNNTVVGIILWRGQACFSVSVHHVFSHLVYHVSIYLGMNCLAKKEYKFPIVKWSGCGNNVACCSLHEGQSVWNAVFFLFDETMNRGVKQLLIY